MQKLKGPLSAIPHYFRPKRYHYLRHIFMRTEGEQLAQVYVMIVYKCKQKDCPICLSNVTLNPDGVTNQALPKVFYQTPCGHDFHKKCLTEWVTYKDICPICRGPLPILSEEDIEEVFV